MAYNFLKIFCSIVLLKALGKLIEKFISKRVQNQSIIKNFVYPNQLDGLKQYLTINTGILLTHLIHLGWVKDL